MSFVNLLANDIWSEADIVKKCEDIVHAEFPLIEENILHRKVTAATIGSYSLTPEETQQLGEYKSVCERAKQEGIQARLDMTLLYQIMEYENAFYRLQQPIVEPIVEDDVTINQEEVDVDSEERDAAQIILGNGSEEVIYWFEQRNPVID